MSGNQYRLMSIPLLATLIMAGFVTTVGLLTEPAATHYGVGITDIAAQFTWFTGGVFLGGILAFFVFDYFAIRPVILWSYLISIGLIGWLHFGAPYGLLPLLAHPLLGDDRDTAADHDGQQRANHGQQQRQ